MKLAIMQPYFFPYIGYFQLIGAVDKFIFYDDVNYIKSGWINRNRISLGENIRYITVPLAGASSFKKINETRISSDDKWTKNILSSIDQCYKRAKFYTPVCKIIEEVICEKNENIADLSRHSIVAVLNYLNMPMSFVGSSSVYKNEEKKGVDRVLDICRIEGADEYWNLPGGRNLYSADLFSKNKINLMFMSVSINSYPQIGTNFVGGLSIIDVLMHNKPSTVLDMISISR